MVLDLIEEMNNGNGPSAFTPDLEFSDEKHKIIK